MYAPLTVAELEPKLVEATEESFKVTAATAAVCETSRDSFWPRTVAFPAASLRETPRLRPK